MHIHIHVVCSIQWYMLANMSHDGWIRNTCNSERPWKLNIFVRKITCSHHSALFEYLDSHTKRLMWNLMKCVSVQVTQNMANDKKVQKPFHISTPHTTYVNNDGTDIQYFILSVNCISYTLCTKCTSTNTTGKQLYCFIYAG